MRLSIDTNTKTLVISEGDENRKINLYSKDAFEILSREWVKVGWSMKYQYTFSWMGRPVIQLPEDMIRIQEIIFSIRPDLIIETGVAHGGSLIFYSSLCKALDKGRIIGVDIEIRSHNRKAIESHPLSDRITLIEGSSVEPHVLAKVRELVNPNDKVLVILDSNHTYQHVYAELEAYSSLVSVGSYIVATDGIMYDLHDVPRGSEDWVTNNPTNAAIDFVKNNPHYIIEQPKWIFNESELSKNITHWPGAWIKRVE